MSFKNLLEKMETFQLNYFSEIENLVQSSEEKMPEDLKVQIRNDSEALLYKFSSYIKQIDQTLQNYKEFYSLSQRLNELKTEKTFNENKIIMVSNFLDTLLEEVKNSMKDINKNMELKPQEIIDYARKINDSLAAPQKFLSTDPDPVTDFFPHDEEKFRSTLQFYFSKRTDEYIIKAKMPQIKFLNGVLEYDETRIRATTALLIELASIDKSFIRYTLNDTCPTAQIGLMYSEPIEIRETCKLKAICFKQGFRESDLLEKAIEIVVDENGNFYFDQGARRPGEEIDSERMKYSFYDTPFTPSSNIQMTPYPNYFMNFTPQYTPNHNYKEEEEDDKNEEEKC